jgi:hypothetical protein
MPFRKRSPPLIGFWDLKKMVLRLKPIIYHTLESSIPSQCLIHRFGLIKFLDGLIYILLPDKVKFFTKNLGVS